MKQKFIKVCPQCGSTNLSHSNIGEGMLKDRCRNCGYEAPIFPEMTMEEAKKFKEKKCK